MNKPETPTDPPAAPLPPCANCVSEHGRPDPTCPYCHGTGVCASAAPTGTDAGVAELIERLRTKLAVVKEAQRNKELSLWVPEHHASWNDIEECVDALAQQATQLQELTASIQESRRWAMLRERDALRVQLTSLRAELETAQQAMRDAIVSMAISNYSTAENLLAAALAPTND